MGPPACYAIGKRSQHPHVCCAVLLSNATSILQLSDTRFAQHSQCNEQWLLNGYAVRTRNSAFRVPHRRLQAIIDEAVHVSY